MTPDELDFIDGTDAPAPEPEAKAPKAKAKAAKLAPEEPVSDGLVEVRIVGGRLPRAETHEPGEDPRQLQDGEIVRVTKATAEKWDAAGAARIL